MQDMQVQLEQLQDEAAKCAKLAALTTDKAKRELFEKLAEHYTVLANEVRKALADANREPGP